MNTPHVIISWNTVEQETKRVFRYLENFESYQGDAYQLRLPKGVSHASAYETVKKCVAHEYDLGKHEEQLKTVISDWDQVEDMFFRGVEEILQIDPLPNYHGSVTQYGTAGSYHPPSSIVLNIYSRHLGFYTIAHEIIHLLIHDLIEKHDIGHWQKERLVDDYFFQVLGVERFQGIPNSVDVKQIDEIFHKNLAFGAAQVIRELKEKKN